MNGLYASLILIGCFIGVTAVLMLFGWFTLYSLDRLGFDR
jgi:hypothetical protein